MADWVIKSTDLYLSLIYDRMHELIYDSKVIHADETPVKVMRINDSKVPGGKKTYMWVYRSRPLHGTHPIVLYDWQSSRRADHPKEFLQFFSGTVVTDGYQVYHKLGKERPDLKSLLLDPCQKTFCRFHKICRSQCCERIYRSGSL